MDVKVKKRIGELLIENNIITRENLELALKKQKEAGELLGNVLIEMGFVEKESDILPLVAKQYGVEYVDLKRANISHGALQRIPAKIANRYTVMPVDYSNGVLTVAMAKPYDIVVQDNIRMVAEADIRPVLASCTDIKSAIHTYYGVGAEAIEQILDGAGLLVSDLSLKKKQEVHDLDKIASEATIGKFLNQIFLQAYRDRATDIHIEPFENEIVVRFRIDGVLHDISVPDEVKYFHDAINSRIKIMASLDITECRIPQDGRFRVLAEGINLDFRVSFLPTPHGESVVLRILNSAQLLTFSDMNLSHHEQKLLKSLINKPHGIIFLTGPTGSGKTTTLYSCLSCINTVEKKIITIEDPIEYQLSGINQVQINPAIGLTFAAGLRSMLRHDPDVIMVGEVRDVETAEISIQSALTGHLIFSTLHTNDAAGGVTRLINMGIEPYLITSTVECFIAQRLVRVACPHCKQPHKLSRRMMHEFGVSSTELFGLKTYKAKGCRECNGTGYLGRVGIFEFLLMNDKIIDKILKRASATDIKKIAVANGMRTLRQSGWEKVKRGITTPEEVIRVTQERSKRR